MLHTTTVTNVAAAGRPSRIPVAAQRDARHLKSKDGQEQSEVAIALRLANSVWTDRTYANSIQRYKQAAGSSTRTGYGDGDNR